MKGKGACADISSNNTGTSIIAFLVKVPLTLVNDGERVLYISRLNVNSAIQRHCWEDIGLWSLLIAIACYKTTFHVS